MTLAEVTARERACAGSYRRQEDEYQKGRAQGIEDTIKHFEADPDFTLRPRLEALIERQTRRRPNGSTEAEMFSSVDELRALLKAKP